MKLHFSKLVSFSWNKTKSLLFPCNFKRWLKILLVVWLSGHAIGLGTQLPNTAKKNAVLEKKETAQASSQSQLQKEAGVSGSSSSASGEVKPFANRENVSPQLKPPSSLKEALSQKPKIPTAVLVLLVLVGILIGLIFAWWVAPFNFILLDLITTDSLQIRKSFAQHRANGNSYFSFSILATLILLGCLAILAFPLIVAPTLRNSFILLVIIILAIFLAVALVILYVLVEDFVLPVMYQNRTSCFAAFKNFFAHQPKVGKILNYLLIKLGFGILSVIIALSMFIIIGICFAIPGIAIGAIGFLLIKIAAFLKPVLAVFGLILLVIAFFAFLLVVSLTTLPVAIFLRTFSLAYLSRLIPDYNLLGCVLPGEESVTGS